MICVSEDAQVRGALELGRLDELGAPARQRLRAREPRIGRPGGERDRDHRVLDARAERGGEGERQHQAREGQEDVGDAHQHGVDPAAEISRGQPDREADRHHDDRDQGDDGQRDARAEEDARVDVAAELVGAERMRGRHRLQPVLEHLGWRRRDRRTAGPRSQSAPAPAR